MGHPGTILVTGATGRVGGQVVAELARRGTPVRALSRDPDSATTADVEVVGGDLAAPSGLDAALDGVDRVFLVFPSVAADHAAEELVTTLAARVRRIVYLSAAGVPDEPGAQDTAPDGTIMASHAHLERLLAESGVGRTFLRSSGFAANTLMWAEQIRHGDTVRWFHGGATRALIHERDLAAVGVATLLDDGLDGARLHLTGPEQLTQVQMLDVIGDALGRPLRFAELDPDEVPARLFPDLPPAFVSSIVDGHAAMVDEPEPATDTVARILGRPALTFARWARDHAAAFG